MFVAAVVTGAVAIAVTGSAKPTPTVALSAPSNRPQASFTKHPNVSSSHPASLTALAHGEAGAVDASLRYTGFVTTGIPRRREVALTFDDGPGPYTESIVSTLVRTHTPATFFIVGQQLQDFARVLRDELRNGFEIGDHTENHAWLTRLNAAGQYSQVNDAALRIRGLGGAFPRLFRPPYGAVSAGLLKVLRGLHMLMVLWSVDPGDWRRPGVRAIVSTVLSHARPGSIVIMHDGGGDRSQTVAALPAIIDGLRRQHFELVSMSQLLRDDPPPHGQPLPHLSGQ